MGNATTLVVASTNQMPLTVETVFHRCTGRGKEERKEVVMQFHTSIYGDVEIPVRDDGLLYFMAVCQKFPRLRVEAKRGDLAFKLPLGSIVMDDIDVQLDPSIEPRISMVGEGIMFS